MIDWTRIQELREEIGPEDFSEVAEMFIAEVDETVRLLENHKSPDTLADDLHFLKGSALNLGFADLADACQSGETTARAGQPEQVNLPQVVAIYKSSREAFLSSEMMQA